MRGSAILGRVGEWFASRNANVQDTLAPDPPSYVEEGTVGWEDSDADNFYDIGTASNDGHLLVRVQLFRGKSPNVKIKPGVGQGHRILCRVGLMPFRVPPVGTPVLVAIPGGDIQTAGNPVIFATIEQNPVDQFTSDRVVWDFGPSTHVVLRGKSVSLMDSNNNARFIAVGQPRAGGNPGFTAMDETGTGIHSESGTLSITASAGSPPTARALIMLTSTEMDLMMTTGTSLKSSIQLLPSGDIYLVSTNNYLYGQGNYIGPLATAATTGLYGPSGITGLPSVTVYISP